MISTFVEHRHPRDPRGRFAPTGATESDLELAPSPVLVRDARGMNVAVTPDTLDDGSRHLYRNGQCVALALALARCRPGTGVSVLTYEGDDGCTYVQHAWAVTEDGTYVDVDGEHDPEAIDEQLAAGEFAEAGDDEFTDWAAYDPDELDLAAEETSGWIGTQRHDLAAGHAPLVWEEVATSAQ